MGTRCPVVASCEKESSLRSICMVVNLVAGPRYLYDRWSHGPTHRKSTMLNQLREHTQSKDARGCEPMSGPVKGG